MLVLLVARFDVSFDEWRIVFDQDEPIRHQFANDFVVGRVDNHTAMIKCDVFDPEKMDEIMSIRMAEPDITRLGLSHEIFELHRTN